MIDPVLLASASVTALAVLSGGIAVALRRVVSPNEVHIVQSRKATTSFGKDEANGNVYYAIPPFVPIWGLTVSRLPVSIFSISLNGYEAYDVNRVPFLVDVRAFFKVSDTNTAAQRVSSTEALTDQLTFILQGSVRRILATNPLEMIMQDRSKLGAEFTQEVDGQLSEWGVSTVKSIEFMDLRDAQEQHVIKDLMAKDKARIEKESRIAVALNMQEAKLAEIAAEREVETNKQKAMEQVGIRTAEKEQAIGVAQQQASQEVLAQAKITAQAEKDVQQVNDVRSAEIIRQVAEVQAQQNKTVTVVNAEAAKEVKIVTATADKEQLVLIADGQLQASKKEAEGALAVGASKAEAERLLLNAPVNAQITLAKEIGANQNYQDYLIRVRGVEAQQAVGVAMSEAIAKADLKVIANGGDITGGVSNIVDLFTAKGATNIVGALTALSQSEEGKAVVNKLTGAGKPKKE